MAEKIRRKVIKKKVKRKKKPKKPSISKRIKNWIKRRSKKTKFLLFIILPAFTTLNLWLFWGIPSPFDLDSRSYPVSTKIFDRNGQLIFEFFADQRRTPIKVEDLPQHVIDATIAIEDKDFYTHHGFDVMGIARALYNTVFKNKLQGGSTLSQQLVKNALLTPERTIKRKAQEFALTLAVETIHSKREILELYLNQIPYGSTAYGIDAAAELYFGKNSQDLTLSEATLLAGLTAAPTRYSPFGANPDLASNRQGTVLRRMLEDGYISERQANYVKSDSIRYAKAEVPKAPHFSLWIKDQLVEKYGQIQVEQGGLRVTTTLDLSLQEYAQEVVKEELASLAKYDVGNGAVLITKPSTGEILTMVGSKDWNATDEDGKVNIIFANRQPGSSIKPLNYALAIRDHKITPSTVLADVPTCFLVVGQKAYCPRNYDGSFHGAAQARFALGNSYNIPAVKVLALNGLENFVDFSKDMGITTFTDPSNYGLSLTLGGGEVKPFDMAVAFGIFANSGIKQPLISILRVEDWKGNLLGETQVNELEGDRILTSDITFLISHILHDNNSRSQAFGTSSFLRVKGHPEVSVKTGTTNDRRDNWTIGYTAHALAVAWVGNNDNTPMKAAVSGVSGASPIWNTVILEALDKAEEGFYGEDDTGHAWPRQPDGVAGRNVCWTTGNLVSGPKEDPGCPSRFEYFLKDNLPATNVEIRQDLQIDRTLTELVNKDTLPENIETQNHPIIYDPLGILFCLDCAIPTKSVTISYPLKL